MGRIDPKAHREMMETKAIEVLGGVCAVCGTMEDLQFDHIERDSKSFDVRANLEYSFESTKFWDEVAKCQLLCRSHHEEKTAREELGESNPAAKLTENGVRRIRELASRGISSYVIADKIGVSQSCVSNVLTGRYWSHVV